MSQFQTNEARVPVVIFTYDRTGLVTVFEAGVLSAAGLDPDERPARALLERCWCPIAPEHVRQALAGEEVSVVAEAAGRVLEVHHFPLRHPCDGIVDLVIGVVFDVTDGAAPDGPDHASRREPEPRAATLAVDLGARYDPVVDLPGRPLLNDRLDQAIVLARRGCARVALLLVGLDGVSEMGARGLRDALLLRAGRRVRELLRESDTLARLDGSTLGALLVDIDRAGALRVAEKLARALAEPFLVAGRTCALAPAIGLALFPEHGADADAVLRSGWDALERARRSGGCAVADDDDRHRGTAMLAELRDGIERGELVLHYQPLVDLGTGETVALEALARWQHPQRGLLPPAAFIPLVEKAGLVRPLASRVLMTALGHCRTWRATGHAVGVAVNLSMRNLLDPQLPDTVAALLRTWGAEPAWLRLEITESVVMTDRERVVGTLGRLREMGAVLAIDDVGSGYASLSLARELPVQQLKIDKSGVAAMAHDRAAVASVRATIDLGHSLGLEVVAEGVEERATWEALRAMDCDLAQGYYVSPALPLDEVERWLAAEPRISASA